MKSENENLPLTLNTTRLQKFFWLFVASVLVVGAWALDYS